jgi:hypothetical protein
LGESGGSSNYGGKGAACRTLAGSCYDSYSSRCAPMLILNGNTIAGPIATWPQTIALVFVANKKNETVYGQFLFAFNFLK